MSNKEEFWTFVPFRKEWICKHGVGHYDPDLVKYTVHGCDGCCNRLDFPPIARKTNKSDENLQ